jgi:proton-translocating NADH-quinone oxidoreductase chain M
MVGEFLSNVLNILLFFPALGAVVVILLPEDQPRLVKWTAFALTIPPLIMALGIFFNVQNAELSGGFLYEYQAEWFPEIGASWHVGVDGISIAMILLTALLVPLALLIAWEHIEGTKGILSLILFLEMAMFGVFMAQDMIVFFIFWELGLVPMYFMINQWGGANRGYASMKFFVYTMAASLGLLLAMQLIAFSVGGQVAYEETLATLQADPGVSGDLDARAEQARDEARPTFDLPTWTEHWPTYPDGEEMFGINPSTVKSLAFLGFFLAFAVKIPVWPFHTWLPDAHTEAPTAGSMLLAGVLLKQGAYGFIRIVIPLFPREFTEARTPAFFDDFQFTYVGLFALLGMLGIVLGAFAAWAQDDLKKLVAYSSVNHMGFVVLGLAAMALIYGTLWAQAPAEEGGADDPQLALVLAGQELEDEDIEQYSEVFEVPPTTTEIEDLTLEQQQRLAIRKLKDLDLDYNARNATVALNGAVLQMFNHGLSSAGMFLLVGALYHKAHTRDVRRFGGLWHIVPVFAGLFVFTSMASLGLPGLNGFTGEWLIVSGTFGLPKFRLLVVLSMLGLLLTGAYILKGIRILQGPPNEEWQEYHDEHHSLEISIRETIAMAPLVALMLLTGIFPNWILPVINDSVDAIFSAFLL